MWHVPVFAAERDAGLEERIKSSGSIAYASAACLMTKEDLLTHASLLDKEVVRATNVAQPDLHYLKTLLVSSNWNKNDDVFDIGEVWAARHSPEDKPFNYEHHGDDIIGHITGNWVIGDDEKVVSDDTTVEKLPNLIHIITAAVLYRVWEDADLQKRMDSIIADIAKGKWFVSMEALFRGFDYAILKADNTQAILKRGEKTAFLTKHLKAYGGTGVYEDYRVGRLLRNITFSGKGLVENPANPESVIFKENEPFNSKGVRIFSSFKELGYSPAIKEREKKMTDTEYTAKLKRWSSEKKALTEKVESLQAVVAKFDSEKVKAREGILEADVKSRDEQIAGLKAELTAVQEQVKAADAQIGVWKTKAEKLELDIEAAKVEQARVALEQKKVTRVATLKAAYDCDDTKAAELYETFSALDDEKFKVHADYMSQKVADYKSKTPSAPQDGGVVGKPPIVAQPQMPGKETDKPAPMAGLPTLVQTIPLPQKTITAPISAPSGAVNANVAVLDVVTPTPSPALQTMQTDDGVEQVRASIADYMAGYFDLPKEEPVAGK